MLWIGPKVPITLHASSSGANYKFDASTVKGVTNAKPATGAQRTRNPWLNDFINAPDYNNINVPYGTAINYNLSLPGAPGKTISQSKYIPATGAPSPYLQQTAPANGYWLVPVSYSFASLLANFSFNSAGFIGCLQPGAFFKLDSSLQAIVQGFFRRTIIGVAEQGFVEEVPTTLPAYNLLDKGLPPPVGVNTYRSTMGHGSNLLVKFRRGSGGSLYDSRGYFPGSGDTVVTGKWVYDTKAAQGNDSYLWGNLNLFLPFPYNGSYGYPIPTPLSTGVNYTIRSSGNFLTNSPDIVSNSCAVGATPAPPTTTVLLDCYNELSVYLGTVTVGTYVWTNVGYSTLYSRRYYSLWADLPSLGGLSLPAGTVTTFLRSTIAFFSATTYQDNSGNNISNFSLNASCTVGCLTGYIDDLNDTWWDRPGAVGGPNPTPYCCLEDGDYRPGILTKI